MSPSVNSTNGALAAAERNNFFYGLLMDVGRFTKDQTYFIRQHRLHNRLVTGVGVVCGLDVAFDPADPALAVIRPGMALDGAGRDIIVPADRVFDPRQLTDENGTPVGSPISQGEVIVCLRYAEECTDLEPVLVPECGKDGDCAPSTIRETYRVVVRQPQAAPPPAPGCGLGPFPIPPGSALRDLLAQRINGKCADASNACIPLARITLPGGPIDTISDRPLVYSNALLFELIVCLAQRLAQTGGAPIVNYVAGDFQTAPQGQPLPAGLVVRVTDSSGNSIPNVSVRFNVVQGGGTVSPDIVPTNGQGRSTTQWTMGPPGPQEVTASVQGSPFTVTFRATSTQ